MVEARFEIEAREHSCSLGNNSVSGFDKRLDIKFISMADDELVDQKKYLEDRCKPKCAKPLFDYQACVQRIEGDESEHKHCTGQYFDYWSCVDKCVAPKLLEKLK